MLWVLHQSDPVLLERTTPPRQGLFGCKIMSPELTLDPVPHRWREEFLQRFLVPGESSCGGNVVNYSVLSILRFHFIWRSVYSNATTDLQASFKGMMSNSVGRSPCNKGGVLLTKTIKKKTNPAKFNKNNFKWTKPTASCHSICFYRPVTVAFSLLKLNWNLASQVCMSDLYRCKHSNNIQ